MVTPRRVVYMAAMANAPTLFQFRASHFNEKARWALDWKRVPHVRQTLLPGPHIPRMLWMTGQQQVPALITDVGAIVDSTRIIAHLEERHPDRPLYPVDDDARRRALALEDWFDEHLGPSLRRVVFAEVLDDGDFMTHAFAGEEGALMQTLYRAVLPGLRIVMRSSMGIDDAGVARSRIEVTEALDRIETELQPSGYLVGDAFTVADLTAAALLSPIVRPAEFPYSVPALPEGGARYRAALASHPAFRWAEDMYRRHRGTSSAI
ncbi:MAG TPA: glutathione S-transferase family protein [Candidatus Binatia bacterium]|jgi:glutathione S-transferase|nr:glutathione S-transferase family protein [Candidatus Binatia bacterium]